MKERYEAPELEVTECGAEDVITTSNELPLVPAGEEEGELPFIPFS